MVLTDTYRQFSEFCRQQRTRPDGSGCSIVETQSQILCDRSPGRCRHERLRSQGKGDHTPRSRRTGPQIIVTSAVPRPGPHTEHTDARSSPPGCKPLRRVRFSVARTGASESITP
jgi:hypothetical protein